MRPLVWLMLLMLTACAAGPLEASPPAPAVPAPQPITFGSPPPAPAVAAAVVKRFDKAKDKELPTVLGPDATEDQIAAIRAADGRARRALTALGLQGHRITDAALAEARSAVRALESALESH